MGELYCPQLGGFVEWTDERERHVTLRHPDLLLGKGVTIWRRP